MLNLIEGKLVVRKKTSSDLDYFSVGESITITHEITNIGEG